MLPNQPRTGTDSGLSANVEMAADRDLLVRVVEDARFALAGRVA